MSLIFNVSGDDFLAGLSSLQNVTGKKGTMPILGNVLIETGTDSIILTGTDLEVGIKNTISSEVLSPGAITLPSKKLFEIVRQSGAEQIRIEIMDNEWAQIIADSADYKLAGMSSMEYPEFPKYRDDSFACVESSILMELIDKTIFSVAQEGEQFNLTGILFEKGEKEGKNSLRMVSSDGHRLSLHELVVESDIDCLNFNKTTLIPRKGIIEIRKLCENSPHIFLSIEENQLVVKTEKSLMIIRLLDGDFPPYENLIGVINKDSITTFNRQKLVSSLKKINLFTEDRYNAIHFDIKTNKLTLSSHTMDIGSAKDELDVECTQEELHLGFNGRYLVETLQVMNSETVRAYIHSEEIPCMIEGDDDQGFISIIMPMKI